MRSKQGSNFKFRLQLRHLFKMWGTLYVFELS